jgi:SAM-dependent methyltransferase
MRDTLKGYLDDLIHNGSSILTRSLKSWRSGIGYEVDFWDKWFKTEGLEWHDDYLLRLQPQPLSEWILRLLPREGDASVLDVGSGPITKTGHLVEGRKVDLTAVDPLAKHYLRIMHKYGVTPPIKTVFSFSEDLSSRFPRSHFDVIACTNALDHAIEPVWGLIEMLMCLKIGGTIILSHRRNEAEVESYSGSHHWNFDKGADDFIIWNQHRFINVTNLVDGFASVKSEVTGDHIAVHLHKENDIPIDPLEYQRKTRAILLECLFDL